MGCASSADPNAPYTDALGNIDWAKYADPETENGGFVSKGTEFINLATKTLNCFAAFEKISPQKKTHKIKNDREPRNFSTNFPKILFI